jgi:hypothetical protein
MLVESSAKRSGFEGDAFFFFSFLGIDMVIGFKDA